MVRAPLSSLQRRDFAGAKAVDGHLPRCRQLVLVDFDPRLHEARLRARQRTGEQFAAVDGELRLLPLVLRVDMRQVVLLGGRRNTFGSGCRRSC